MVLARGALNAILIGTFHRPFFMTTFILRTFKVLKVFFFPLKLPI